MEKETPTECPECKCTNLVSDQCKGECLCHHPELTPTEEWGNKLEELVNILRRDSSMDSVHFHNFIRTHRTTLLTELEGEIEGKAVWANNTKVVPLKTVLTLIRNKK